MNTFLLLFFIIWLGGWWLNVRISKFENFNLSRFIVPSLFGIVFMLMWELIVIGLTINPVLLPAPSAIAVKFSSSLDILWIDFVQTLVKGALSGYILGCGAAFLTAIAIDKFDFLKRNFDFFLNEILKRKFWNFWVTISFRRFGDRYDELEHDFFIKSYQKSEIFLMVKFENV